MTKFKVFLDKYGVQLTREKCKNHYCNYRKWRNGKIKNPSFQSLKEFYDIFKKDIEFNEMGLMDCFVENNESFDSQKPFILGIEGGHHRRYPYLFVNYLLNNLIPKTKVLVLDQAKYNHIYNAVGRPYTKAHEILELKTIKDHKGKITKTKDKKIDYCTFSIYDEIKNDPKSLREISIKLFSDLKTFKKYDLIIINYQENSNVKPICRIIRQMSDQLFFIGLNNKYENDYDYLRNQATNLEMLTSTLNHKQKIIVKKHDPNKFVDYWLMSRQITGEALLKTADYIPMLDPKIFEDLKYLYNDFLKLSKYKGFREEDYYSMISYE